MTRTYLSHVELIDFRTFGRFALELVPGPGLTLLVGPNGLGKSSFFDAVEWALTGQIRRFADHVGGLPEANYLTRRDAVPGAHRVTLGFDTGELFTRTATEAPDPNLMLAALKASDWGGIGDLAAYLALTHFLGQAAQQRFTSRKRSDQWEALKGPSGIDRLEQVRLALRGPGTAAAFRRRAAQQTAEIDVAEQTLARWRDRSARLASLRASASAAGLPPLEQIEHDLDRLASVAQSYDAGGAEISDSSRSTTSIERLIAIRRTLDVRRDANTAQMSRLGSLRSIATRYAALSANTDPDGLTAAAAKHAVEDATAALSEAAIASRQAERNAAAAAETSARAGDALRRSNELTAMAADAARFKAAIQALNERCDALTTSLRALDTEEAANRAALDDVRARRAARRALAERTDQDDDIRRRLDELVALFMESQGAHEAATLAEEAAHAASASVPTETELATLRADVAAAEAKLAVARRRATEMADALATVAKHLGDHDKNCPVCSSSFPHGTLKQLAEAAAGSGNEQLAADSRRVEAARRVLDEAEAAVAATAQATARAEISRLNAATAAAAHGLVRARVATLLEVDQDADLAAAASKRAMATSTEIATLDDQDTRTSVTLAELEDAADATARTRATLDAELAAVERERAEVASRAAQLGLAIASEPGVADGFTTRLEVDQNALAAADAAATDARVALAGALMVEAAARDRLDAAEMARARLAQTVADSTKERQALANEWTEAGLTGLPTEQGVTERALALERRSAELETLTIEADRIARALSQLAALADLRELEAALRNEAGDAAASDPFAHERTLQRKLEKARGELAATTSTREAVNAYTEQLKIEADNFSTRFLMPLNELIDDFNKTLLSTPGETVQFSADAAVNRTDFGMRLLYPDRVDNSRYDTKLAPQLVLSEGQMAANGFSILCAASVAYPWSRWRALLLDDPLQHNDIIHAAAFADVMRNLVEYEGYQLVMSSHDRAESEFMFRKFDAAGLPVTMVNLTAPSREGVKVAEPRLNGAASHLMARAAAATA